MTTDQFIDVLKQPTRCSLNVAMRQALFYFLYKNNVPVIVIAHCTKYTRGAVYNGINKQTDLLDCNDEIAANAYDEVLQHKISIQPVLVEQGIQRKAIGQALVIDNTIY